jgi:hypothetical protein
MYGNIFWAYRCQMGITVMLMLYYDIKFADGKANARKLDGESLMCVFLSLHRECLVKKGS